MAKRDQKIVKRGYELGGGKAREGKIPPPRDPGPGAGAKPKSSPTPQAAGDEK